MKSPAPFDKVDVIKCSIRCFTCGIIGILPLIGLPFAIAALGYFIRVQRRKGSVWNPANAHLTAGALCATAGLGLTVIVFGIMLISPFEAING
jgi:hypothetical protein